MNNLIKSHNSLRQDPDNLLDQLYGIIDTKLQYIDHQVNICFEAFSSSSDAKFTADSYNTTAVISQGQELLYNKVEAYSKEKRALLILRSLLNSTSLYSVFEMLQDDLYKSLGEKEMKKFIKEKSIY